MKTSTELTLIKISILQSYDALQESLNALCEAICNDSDLPIWMNGSNAKDARRIANEGISSFFSAPGQPANETINCLGVIGASPATLELIAEVNKNKLAFQAAMEPLSKQQRMAPDPENPERTISTPLARVVLREINLGGLLQRQVTRQIIALDYVPLRIGFTTTSRSPSVVRITSEQARTRLERLGDDYSIKGQIALLDKLAEDEMLAVVIPVPQHVRQNISYLSSDGVKQQVQKKTSLPLFYPAKTGESLPLISVSDSGTKKQERADREIERRPFLRSIHAHRYLAHVRDQKVCEMSDEIEGETV